MYDFYNETKKAALSMQNLSKATYVDLEQVFLNVSERTYILHQIFGLGEQEQKEFNQLANELVKKEKVKKIKIIKQDEMNLPFLLHCCLIQFQKKNDSPIQQQ